MPPPPSHFFFSHLLPPAPPSQLQHVKSFVGSCAHSSEEVALQASARKRSSAFLLHRPRKANALRLGRLAASKAVPSPSAPVADVPPQARSLGSILMAGLLLVGIYATTRDLGGLVALAVAAGLALVAALALAAFSSSLSSSRTAACPSPPATVSPWAFWHAHAITFGWPLVALIALAWAPTSLIAIAGAVTCTIAAHLAATCVWAWARRAPRSDTTALLEAVWGGLCSVVLVTRLSLPLVLLASVSGISADEYGRELSGLSLSLSILSLLLGELHRPPRQHRWWYACGSFLILDAEKAHHADLTATAAACGLYALRKALGAAPMRAEPRAAAARSAHLRDSRSWLLRAASHVWRVCVELCARCWCAL